MSSKERALLDFLPSGPLGSDELLEQARTAQVDAVCSCGCSSVFLLVDESASRAEFMADLVPFGRTDWVPISAMQRKSRGSTEITLHVSRGLLFELEIWTGGYGVRPRVDVAKLEHLDRAAADEIA